MVSLQCEHCESLRYLRVHACLAQSVKNQRTTLKIILNCLSLAKYNAESMQFLIFIKPEVIGTFHVESGG